MISVVLGGICFEESSEAMLEEALPIFHGVGRGEELPLTPKIDPADNSPLNHYNVENMVRVLIDGDFTYTGTMVEAEPGSWPFFTVTSIEISFQKPLPDSDRLLCKNLASMLLENEVDAVTLFVGNAFVVGLSEKYRSDLRVYEIAEYLSRLRPDSNGLRALNWLIENLLPMLMQDPSVNEELALRTSVICLKRLSNPNRTAKSAFLELVHQGYFTTLSSGIKAARGILWADAALMGDESMPCDLRFTKIIDPPQFRENMRFLEIAEGISANYHGIMIFVSAAIDLADAATRDPVAAKVLEVSQHDPKIFSMLLRKPSLAIDLADAVARDPVAARVWEVSQHDPKIFSMLLQKSSFIPLARAMLTANFADPIDFMLIFEDAEYDFGMSFEDTVDLWMDISDSPENKTFLAFLKPVAELLNGSLSFCEIHEMATEVTSGRKTFRDIDGELPLISGRAVGNFSSFYRR
jgi:hypothetical protein